MLILVSMVPGAVFFFLFLEALEFSKEKFNTKVEEENA